MAEIKGNIGFLRPTDWKPSDDQIKALVDAMDQLLDDMGADGLGVCLYAKAQARIAYDPWCHPDSEMFFMPLHEAQKIVADHNT